MLLCRSLPPADAGEPINRHRAGSPLCRVTEFRQPLQSQPNPLSLTLSLSMGYLRIDARQTHCAYVFGFQELTAKNRPFFRKSQWSSCLPSAKRGVRGWRLVVREPDAPEVTGDAGTERLEAGGLKLDHPYEPSWKVARYQLFSAQNRRNTLPVEREDWPCGARYTLHLR
jgi:hypothetical protein